MIRLLGKFHEREVSKSENWRRLAGLAIGMAVTPGVAERAGELGSPVTAIDIALEPDQIMIGHAQAANALLLKNFPKGFSLDATHHPHVSIFAGFVPTADLSKVYSAADKVLEKEEFTTWKLTAFKYYYISARPNRPGRHRGQADA